MTRDEAKAIISDLIEWYTEDLGERLGLSMGKDVYMDALEALWHGPEGDLISRSDAIEAVASADETNGNIKVFSGLEIIEMLNALPSAEPPTGELISKADAIELLTEIVFDEPPYFDSETLCRLYAEEQINTLPSAEIAETEPIVIRSRTLLPTKDFKAWARRIRETNPNAVVIPCDAEVVSADAVCEDTQTEERARFVSKETELAHTEARLENAEKRLQELPKYTNCTEFIEWLTEVVLDDEDWELNAVAYGEVIARKLKKLGLLEVKDGYYIRPSAEAVQGEWIRREGGIKDWEGTIVGYSYWYECDQCGSRPPLDQWKHEWHSNFCPICGARMKGCDSE